MADNNTKLDVTAQRADGRTAVEAPPVVETSGLQSTATTAPVQEAKGPAQASPDSAKGSIVPPEKTTFENFNAGEKDPLVGVVIREVLNQCARLRRLHFARFEPSLVLEYNHGSKFRPFLTGPASYWRNRNFYDRPLEEEI